MRGHHAIAGESRWFIVQVIKLSTVNNATCYDHPSGLYSVVKCWVEPPRQHDRIFNFLPLYCPSCGTPTRLDHAENIIRGKFKAKQALSCAICGVKYQLVDNTEIFRAATAISFTLLVLLASTVMPLPILGFVFL